MTGSELKLAAARTALYGLRRLIHEQLNDQVPVIFTSELTFADRILDLPETPPSIDELIAFLQSQKTNA